jgi:hypothetical protein
MGVEEDDNVGVYDEPFKNNRGSGEETPVQCPPCDQSTRSQVEIERKHVGLENVQNRSV